MYKKINSTREFYKTYRANGGKLAYLVFKEVIDSFHKKAIRKCIDTGHAIELPSHLGSIKVVSTERRFSVKKDGTIRGAIDWGATNAKKKRLLEEGKLLYKPIKNEEGEIIGDNGGEKYMCYHTSAIYYMWDRLASIYLKNGVSYTFDASWSNSKLLSASINENSEVLYDRKNKLKKNASSKNSIESDSFAESF